MKVAAKLEVVTVEILSEKKSLSIWITDQLLMTKEQSGRTRNDEDVDLSETTVGRQMTHSKEKDVGKVEEKGLEPRMNKSRI